MITFYQDYLMTNPIASVQEIQVTDTRLTYASAIPVQYVYSESKTKWAKSGQFIKFNSIPLIQSKILVVGPGKRIILQYYDLPVIASIWTKVDLETVVYADGVVLSLDNITYSQNVTLQASTATIEIYVKYQPISPAVDFTSSAAVIYALQLIKTL